MRIVDVKAYPVRYPIHQPFGWRNGLPGSGDHYDVTWLRVVTDAGVVGHANIDRDVIGVDLVERRLKPLLMGQDALQKELLWQRVWEVDRIEELPVYALGAADIALWDITAQVAGLPLYKVLGGYRSSVPAYASTATFGSTEEFLDVIDQCLAHGFRAIKLHAWGDAHRDAALAQAVRAHVGPDIDLMYDASAGFNPYDALFVGRALEEAGYRWFEEPMREFGTHAYRRLCEALDIPVLAPETADGVHYMAAEFILAGATDMLRTGVDYRGVTGALRVAHLADAFHLNAEVHGGGAANLHLACAIANNTYYESMVLSNPAVVEPGIRADGTIAVPDAPGIGFEIDEEALANGRASATAKGTVA